MKGVAVVALVAAGCLPRGPAPVGTHVLTTRQPASATFLAPGPDGARALLVWQTRADGGDSDLSVASWSPAGGLGPLRPLLQKVSPSPGRCGPFSRRCGIATDDRGRVLVSSSKGAYSRDDPTAEAQLLRLDLTTGATEPVGVFTDFEPAPNGTRVVGLTSEPDNIVVSDGPDRETVLNEVQQYLLVGDDVFYLVAPPPAPTRDGSAFPPGQLFVLRADGTTTMIAGGVAGFDGELVGGAPRLLLRRPLANAQGRAQSLLDPATLAETPLPDGHDTTELVFSDDGHHVALASWIGDRSGDSRTFTFVDLATGAADVVPLDAPSAPLASSLFWRPRHDEAWIIGRGQVFVWRPGQPITAIDAPPIFAAQATDGPRAFTRDGAHYFSFDPAPAGPVAFAPILLVAADDPAGPRLRLNAPGTGLEEIRDLTDGRLLIRTWTTLPERGDIQLVDPARGTIVALATGGTLGPATATRALAQLHWLERANQGDLTLLELPGGTHTLLAENVLGYGASDGLAAGAPLWMLVRSSLPSPYDGLWVAALPESP